MSEQIQEVRTLDVIEMEIRVIQDQGRRVLLSMAIETGRRLEEAKAMVGHGQWGEWLKEIGYSQSNANNLMRVFREYGASQQSLFGGEANSQALGNLSLTKAIQLLALPDQEAREAFVEEHDVEAMSTRELEKALKERDQALREAETAQANAKAAEDARAKMEADMRVMKAASQNGEKAERDLLVTQNALKGERKESELLRKESAALREDLRKAKEELKELKNRPVEVAVETREPTEEELKKMTSAAVEEARAMDRERIAAMEKQLAAADGDVAAFKVLFDAWQESYGRMAECLKPIEEKDPEKAGKLKNAVRAAAEGMGAV